MHKRDKKDKKDKKDRRLKTNKRHRKDRRPKREGSHGRNWRDRSQNRDDSHKGLGYVRKEEISGPGMVTSDPEYKNTGLSPDFWLMTSPPTKIVAL